MSGTQPLQPPPERPRSELASALGACRGALVGVGLFSALSNILLLNGAFFMLQVYDRVLPSRSIPTLIGLSILAGMLYLWQGLLDAIRGRILVRAAGSLEATVAHRIFHTLVRVALQAGRRNDGDQPLRDMDNIRVFLSGPGPIAFFDLPWVPFYLGICFILHPLLGFTALAGALVLGVLALITEIVTRQPSIRATGRTMSRNRLAETSIRNAEVLMAMGIEQRFAERWQEANRHHIGAQIQLSDLAGGLGMLSKVFRMMLQSGLLAIGAYLVIEQQATGGIIIAGSILGGRALAPVDSAIAHWRPFMAARQSWLRLSGLLALCPVEREPLRLPTPSHGVTVKSVSAAPPGQQRPAIRDVSFTLKAGQALGVIGPSASGKSSLARTLVGIWTPLHGKVCLDGAALGQWDRGALGRHIGYLPQDVELLSGTVAQNIARFERGADPAAVLKAAQAAGVHDLIVKLPKGYETDVGEQGAVLSAGQRQWIALARALYGEPFLVVLDEPNSNLDSHGEEAVTRAIASVRGRGGVAVVVAHRPSAITAVDMLMVMAEGRMQAFGPKDDILAKVLQRDAPARAIKQSVA